MKVAILLLVLLALASGRQRDSSSGDNENSPSPRDNENSPSPRDNENSPSPQSGSRDEYSPAGSPRSGSMESQEERNVTVRINSDGFAPADVTIYTGNCVTFMNEDDTSREVLTSEFDTTIEAGESFTFCFTTAGEYRFNATESESETGSENMSEPNTESESEPESHSAAAKHAKKKGPAKKSKNHRNSRSSAASQSSSQTDSSSESVSESATDSTDSSSMMKRQVTGPAADSSSVSSDSSSSETASSSSEESSSSESDSVESSSSRIPTSTQSGHHAKKGGKKNPRPAKGKGKVSRHQYGMITVVDAESDQSSESSNSDMNMEVAAFFPGNREGALNKVAESGPLAFAAIAMVALAGIAAVVVKNRRSSAEYSRLNTGARKQYTV